MGHLKCAMAVMIAVLFSPELLAAPRDDAPKPAALNARTGWLGNTFKGGDRNKGRWVQLDIDDIFVFPDGRVVTNCAWDEAGRAIGFYKDGNATGKVDDYTALTGGPAITADEQYLFAGSSLFCVGSFGGPAPPAPRHFALCGPADRRG